MTLPPLKSTSRATPDDQEVSIRRWNYPQSGSFDASRMSYPLSMAANAFGDPTARAALPLVQSGKASEGDGIVPLDLALIGHTQ